MSWDKNQRMEHKQEERELADRIKGDPTNFD
jgi:hypothetical protein